jgi:hypothetical protein
MPDRMSAIGGEADIMRACPNVANDPKADMLIAARMSAIGGPSDGNCCGNAEFRH